MVLQSSCLLRPAPLTMCPQPPGRLFLCRQAGTAYGAGRGPGRGRAGAAAPRGRRRRRRRRMGRRRRMKGGCRRGRCCPLPHAHRTAARTKDARFIPRGGRGTDPPPPHTGEFGDPQTKIFRCSIQFLTSFPIHKGKRCKRMETDFIFFKGTLKLDEK